MADYDKQDKGEKGGQATALPEATVEKADDGGFRIRLNRLKEDKLHDQASVSRAGQGCFNNPGGPTC